MALNYLRDRLERVGKAAVTIATVAAVAYAATYGAQYFFAGATAAAAGAAAATAAATAAIGTAVAVAIADPESPDILSCRGGYSDSRHRLLCHTGSLHK